MKSVCSSRPTNKHPTWTVAAWAIAPVVIELVSAAGGCTRDYSKEQYSAFFAGEQAFAAGRFREAAENYGNFVDDLDETERQAYRTGEHSYHWSGHGAARPGVEIDGRGQVLIEGFYRSGFAHYRLGGCSIAIGELDSALQHFSKSADFAAPVGRGLARYGVARVHFLKGEYTQTARELAAAYNLISQFDYPGGKISIRLLMARNDLMLGKIDRARHHLNEVQRLVVQVKSNTLNSSICSALADIEFAQGNLEAAEIAYGEALGHLGQRLVRGVVDASARKAIPEATTAGLLLGATIGPIGLLMIAAGPLDSVVDTTEAAYIENPWRRRAEILESLGQVREARGEFLAARDAYLAAFALYEKNLVPSGCARQYQNLGALALKIGGLQEARDYIDRAIAAVTRTNNLAHMAGVYADSARIAISAGDVSRATKDLDNARRVISGKEALPVVAAEIAFLDGRLHMLRKHWADAARAFRVVGNSPAGSVSKVLVDDAALGEAEALLELGEIDAARTRLQALAATFETASPRSSQWFYWFIQARCAEYSGKINETLHCYTQAIAAVESQRSTLALENLKRNFAANFSYLYESYVRAAATLASPSAALDAANMSKARAFSDLVVGRNCLQKLASDPEREEAQMLRERRRVLFLDSLVRGQYEGSHLSSLANKIAVQSESRHRSSRSAARAGTPAAELESIVSARPVKSVDIQAQLDENQAIVEYYLCEKALYIWIVTKDDVQLNRVDVSRAVLRSEIESWRKAVLGFVTSESGDRLMHQAQVLYGFLLEPIEEHLAGKRFIYVSPHDALHYLSFAALHDGKRYVVDKWSFSVLPSSATLPLLRQRDVKPGENVALVGSRNTPDGDRLPYAEKELSELKLLYGSRATLVVGGEAARNKIFQHSDRWGILHFACHAYLDAENPERSGLALGSDATSDGMFTVSDIFALRLKASLVTLSACSTGLGKLSRGDDIVGLSRAFFYAGTPTVCVSLWPVEDQATAELMLAFYRGLIKGRCKADALRDAMLAVRESRREGHSLRGVKIGTPAETREDVFYWAGFTVMGLP